MKINKNILLLSSFVLLSSIPLSISCETKTTKQPPYKSRLELKKEYISLLKSKINEILKNDDYQAANKLVEISNNRSYILEQKINELNKINVIKNESKISNLNIKIPKFNDEYIKIGNKYLSSFDKKHNLANNSENINSLLYLLLLNSKTLNHYFNNSNNENADKLPSMRFSEYQMTINDVGNETITRTLNFNKMLDIINYLAFYLYTRENIYETTPIGEKIVNKIEKIKIRPIDLQLRGIEIEPKGAPADFAKYWEYLINNNGEIIENWNILDNEPVRTKIDYKELKYLSDPMALNYFMSNQQYNADIYSNIKLITTFGAIFLKPKYWFLISPFDTFDYQTQGNYPISLYNKDDLKPSLNIPLFKTLNKINEIDFNYVPNNDVKKYEILDMDTYKNYFKSLIELYPNVVLKRNLEISISYTKKLKKYIEENDSEFAKIINTALAKKLNIVDNDFHLKQREKTIQLLNYLVAFADELIKQL
ncbi:hypothetical protein [Mycoplasmopsis verecunda]|uniref:Lipoprotein n=1 Tax=Mycoplasmopsis verecunda TaxID=171291 RepID=A0A1T4M5E2_9BACT|nr:hypothetical protein [Mycoplasmopsis verecunda]WPB54365.1 hypothetical protein SAM46_02655 [Mycoplasmopsis verecunda]SJZ62087.1 hypothetical protein SAMN02745154_00628 [Mycoplasmopsis verecunda]